MGPVQHCALVAVMLVCALGAPVRVTEINYSTAKTLILELNERARRLYQEVETPEEVAVVNNPPLMIRPEDNCNPDSLQTNPETCLSRVVFALKDYSRIFGDNGIFQGQNTKCDKWRLNATTIAEMADQMLELLKVPVEPPAPMVLANWMTECYLCQDSVERLFSFSIVTARVFNHLSSLQHSAEMRKMTV